MPVLSAVTAKVYIQIVNGCLCSRLVLSYQYLLLFSPLASVSAWNESFSSSTKLAAEAADSTPSDLRKDPRQNTSTNRYDLPIHVSGRASDGVSERHDPGRQRCMFLLVFLVTSFLCRHAQGHAPPTQAPTSADFYITASAGIVLLRGRLDSLSGKSESRDAADAYYSRFNCPSRAQSLHPRMLVHSCTS